MEATADAASVGTTANGTVDISASGLADGTADGYY